MPNNEIKEPAWRWWGRRYCGRHILSRPVLVYALLPVLRVDPPDGLGEAARVHISAGGRTLSSVFACGIATGKGTVSR